MLLKSSSAPILNSWFCGLNTGSESSSDPDRLAQLSRTRSFRPSSSREDNRGTVLSPGVISDSDLKHPWKKTSLWEIKESRNDEDPEIEYLFLSRVPESLVGGSGGGMDCGGGGRRNWDYGLGSDPRDRREDMEAYYEMIIKANPDNSLVLVNYARFLKEVKGNFVKAEEYCGRAILANPSNGDALSLYADLMWQIYRDSARAEAYYDQAVKTDPNDCYILASYARFLWDAEDEEKEEDEEEMNTKETPSTHRLFPLAAAS